MNSRVQKLRQHMSDARLDGMLVYSPENRRYLSGFTGSAGYLVIGMAEACFITDFRYKEQAVAQCKDYDIVVHGNDLPAALWEQISKAGMEKIGIEENFMTVSFFNELKKAAGSIELTGAKNIFDSLRIIKDAEEIACIRRAAEIADTAFSHILEYLKPGISEAAVALELEYHLKRQGASGLSFDSIVASGHRSALPHGVASEKTINSGEFLTLDFGCVYNGYCSDMTRTVFIGKATAEHRKIYQTVLSAQQAALAHIKPGVSGKEADKVARDILQAAGYGEYFGHGLGHGVGLAVHEEPRLSPAGERVLQPGMVVTDEPGIYIPGFGGVRIEDLVLVTETGCESLSKSAKALMEL